MYPYQIAEAVQVLEWRKIVSDMKLDVDMHVNSTDHLFLSALPPLVRRVVTDHGRKASRTTLVNGGIGDGLSVGKSDIF